MDLLYVPYGPRDYETRVAVNRHISQYTRAKKHKGADVYFQRQKRMARGRHASRKRLRGFQRPSIQEAADALHSEFRDLIATQVSLSPNAIRLQAWHLISDQLEDPTARKLMHYATTEFWPPFDPGGNRHKSPFVTNYWVSVLGNEPILL